MLSSSFRTGVVLVVALATTGCIHRTVKGDQKAGLDFVNGTDRCRTEEMLTFLWRSSPCPAKRANPKTARR
jgi:hypothetical protein